MYRVFTFIFDSIFPPRAESLIVRTLDEENTLSRMNITIVGETIALLPFGDPSVRALVHEAKFYASTRAVMLLGTVLREYLSSLESSRPVLAIPIPLSRARLRERGYNQVALIITRALRNTPGYRYENSILTRTKDTAPQTNLRRSERLTNVTGAFSVCDGTKINGQHIILVDDVITTGATMHAAKAALLPHSPLSVTCIALAH